MRNEPLSNEILEVRHEYMAINEKTQGHHADWYFIVGGVKKIGAP